MFVHTDRYIRICNMYVDLQVALARSDSTQQDRLVREELRSAMTEGAEVSKYILFIPFKPQTHLLYVYTPCSLYPALLYVYTPLQSLSSIAVCIYTPAVSIQHCCMYIHPAVSIQHCCMYIHPCSLYPALLYVYTPLQSLSSIAVCIYTPAVSIQHCCMYIHPCSLYPALLYVYTPLQSLSSIAVCIYTPAVSIQHC